MPLAPNFDRPESRYCGTLLSTTVHRHRLFVIRSSFVHHVPCRPPVHRVPLRSDAPHRNQGRRARDVDKCTGLHHASLGKLLVIYVGSVDTSSPCAARRPDSRTSLFTSHSDFTRYILRMFVLTIFFNAQDLRRHRYESNSNSVVQHLIWKSIEELPCH